MNIFNFPPLNWNLVHDEVLGRGRRPREEGRRAELGTAFGVLFSESIAEEEDGDGRGAALLSFEEIGGAPSSLGFKDSVPSIFVGAA